MDIFRLFKKNRPEDLFLKFSPENSSWRVVSWNFDLQNPSDRQWVIEVHHQQMEQIQWVKSTLEELTFIKDKKIIRKLRPSKERETFKNLMNLAIHSTLKYSLELNKSFMLTPVSGATATDIQNEGRALQWLQASFGTLTRAIEQFKGRSDLILSASLFAGTVPETGESVLRLIAFNLDIFYYMRPDSTLLIVVFNDKDKGHGDSKNPTFQQIIKVTKPQFYDEIMKVVNQLAIIGEIS
ncbi:MAG: hypothetical protein AB7I27_17330 [Bacteriovoracaceae bacterium]